jgi:hypothetical protein
VPQLRVNFLTAPSLENLVGMRQLRTLASAYKTTMPVCAACEKSHCAPKPEIKKASEEASFLSTIAAPYLLAGGT